MTTGDLPKSVGVVGWVGAFLFWTVQILLLQLTDMPLADTILVAALLVLVPTFSFVQLPLVEPGRVERLPAYWGSILTLWLIGSACLLVGARARGAASIGLVGLPPLRFVVWSVGLTVGGLLVMFAFLAVASWKGIPETPLLRELIPRTRKERSVFGVLSVAAGFGEEIAYRGYAIGMLGPVLGSGGAALLTSVVFGGLHAYQGWLGMVRTALLGGFFALGFLAAGSLWPAIVAHTVIDLLAGLVLGESLMPPERPVGVVGALDAGSPESEMGREP